MPAKTGTLKQYLGTPATVRIALEEVAGMQAIAGTPATQGTGEKQGTSGTTTTVEAL